MAKDARRWTLEDLIDFESEVAAGTRTPPELRDRIAGSTRGLDGAAARRAGFRLWLDEVRLAGNGAKFTTALSWVGSGLALLLFLAGISGVLGLVDREKPGIHITLFLVLLIGGQWLVLLGAMIAWLLRGRASGGFSAAQAMAGALARKLAGNRDAPWWGRLMSEGGAARAAVLWRIARLVQTGGVFFNVGILCALGGLIFVKDLRFYWESTTETAMASTLYQVTHWLSLPWASLWPSAALGPPDIAASRWHPGQPLQSVGGIWWNFFMMVTLVWGLLPRLLLGLLAWKAGRGALGGLDFQARSHRALWRELTGTGRVETDDKPLDGVLVLDVGGSGLTEESLRPFLLRRLRVHATAWHPVAVLDSGADEVAARSLANAPAGVVLLGEGWSLSPARMMALHAKIRAAAGAVTPVKFLVANTGPDHLPVPPEPAERREWERFVDSLRDPEAEVFFYEPAV